MKKLPRVGLSLMPEEGFRAAASPLFEAGVVDVLEWAVDAPWGLGSFRVPKWADAVVDLYSEAGCLYGHGLGFSALSGKWERRQERWLERLSEELRRRHYRHLTEHFGFMCAPGFLPGAPLPVPMTDGAIRVGREALARLADVVGEPIGLENLAPTLSRRDAEEQVEFIGALLEPQDGFFLLDIHNLYCQSRCLGIPFRELVEAFPLHRVRELHVAGGREWAPPLDPDSVLLCDTHDRPVPDDVFDMVQFAVRACKNLEVVMFERFPYTLDDVEDAARFREDFMRLRSTVEEAHG